MGYSNIYNVQYYLLYVWSIKFAWLFGTNKSWWLCLWTLHWALIKMLTFAPLTLNYYLWPIIPFMFRHYIQATKRNDTNYTFYLYSYVQYLLWYIDQGYVTRKNHSQTLVTLLKVVQLVAIIASCIRFLPSSLITSLQRLLHTSWQTSYQIMHTSCLASCLIFRDANLC